MARIVRANFKNDASIGTTDIFKHIGERIDSSINSNTIGTNDNGNYEYNGELKDASLNYEEKGKNVSIFDYFLEDGGESSTGAATNTKKNSNTSSSGKTPAKTKGIYVKNKSAADGYGPAFLDKVKEVASKHNMDYKELLALMYSESNLNAHSDNGQGYVGFMQLGATAAKNCGTTREAIKNMTPIQQMDVIDKHLTNLEKSMPEGSHKASDYYAANFLPGRCKREVLTTSDESYYKWNKGLDRNGDGKITKTELDQRIKANYIDESCFTA